MDKIVITVVGADRVGIIAKVTTSLYEANVNILDISQTIVGGIFNMMVIADAENANCSFEEISARLAGIGRELGLQIQTQREEIFTAMHRV